MHSKEQSELCLWFVSNVQEVGLLQIGSIVEYCTKEGDEDVHHNGCITMMLGGSEICTDKGHTIPVTSIVGKGGQNVNRGYLYQFVIKRTSEEKVKEGVDRLVGLAEILMSKVMMHLTITDRVRDTDCFAELQLVKSFIESMDRFVPYEEKVQMLYDDNEK